MFFNILTQWWALKAFFDVAQNTAPAKEKYRAREIYRMLSDPSLRLYLEFLCPVVQEIEQLNARFQTSNPNMGELFKLLDMQFKSLKGRVYDSRGKQLHVTLCDFGVKFKEASKEMDQSMVRTVMERCQSFLFTLIKEFNKRVVENQDVLISLSLLKPEKIMKDESKFGDLPFRHFCDDVSSAENEFRKIKQVDWNSENLDEVQFWSKVSKYEVQGEKIFPVLSSYALMCLSLPVSNAYVERIFSIVSYLKDKYANRMQIPMLDSLLVIKTHMQANIFFFKNSFLH